MMNFENLKDQVVDFYGVDFNDFKIDGVVWRAIEDESDGYRSYLDSVIVVEDTNSVFFKQPIAKVKIVYDEDNYHHMWSFIDSVDNHRWLVFGTDYADDYYPMFVFSYFPKKL